MFLFFEMNTLAKSHICTERERARARASERASERERERDRERERERERDTHTHVPSLAYNGCALHHRSCPRVGHDPGQPEDYLCDARHSLPASLSFLLSVSTPTTLI